MDIFEIRKANLIKLIGSRRKGACAEKWEMAPAHLSQVLSNKTAKNLGEDVARRIEQKEGLPHGWLDTLQSDQTADRAALSSASKPAQIVGQHAGLYQGVSKALDIASMLEGVTPRSQALIERIAALEAQGKLSDADLRIIEQIIERFSATE